MRILKNKIKVTIMYGQTPTWALQPWNNKVTEGTVKGKMKRKPKIFTYTENGNDVWT